MRELLREAPMRSICPNQLSTVYAKVTPTLTWWSARGLPQHDHYRLADRRTLMAMAQSDREFFGGGQELNSEQGGLRAFID